MVRSLVFFVHILGMLVLFGGMGRGVSDPWSGAPLDDSGAGIAVVQRVRGAAARIRHLGRIDSGFGSLHDGTIRALQLRMG